MSDHVTRIVSHDYYEGLFVTCSCGWESGMFTTAARAQDAADTHIGAPRADAGDGPNDPSARHPAGGDD